MGCRRWFLGGAFLLVFAVPFGFAAELSVPLLELLTRGVMLDGRFHLQTEGEMELLVEGGDRLSGQVRLGFLTDAPAATPGPGVLSFEAVHLSWAGLFGGSTGLTLFYGERETFGSGAIFVNRFGAPDPGTLYSGIIHFPTGPRYEGIHALTGTGLQIDIAPDPERLLLSWFLYQDGRVDDDADLSTYESGYYSTDIRSLLSFPRLRLEAFAGATFPAPGARLGWYRGGLLFHAAEAGVEFFAQAGIPRWSPSNDPLDIRLLYLLFEPRVRLGKVGLIPTFFWRPAYYLQQPTGEQAFDLNLNILIGGWPASGPASVDPEGPSGGLAENPDGTAMGTAPVSGGLETTLSYVMEEDGVTQSELRFVLSPYLRIQASGFTWDFRLKAHLLPFSLNELVEVFLGVRAEF